MRRFPVVPTLRLSRDRTRDRSGPARHLLVALSIGVIASGCMAPPPPAEEEPVRSFPAPSEEVLSWHKFEVGPHKGYIRAVKGYTGPLHEVYNGEVALIGYYTPMGATYRIDRGGQPEFLGRYDPNDSLRALHGIRTFDVPVRFLPMDEPLTLKKLEKSLQQKDAGGS